ncbi:MAG: hypothetical protein LUD19_01190 [Clostridia bacterium]|nr:hypothetical protein [Clostridia bacterium]
MTIKLLYKFDEQGDQFRTAWFDYSNVTSIQVNNNIGADTTIITYKDSGEEKTVTLWTADIITLHVV